MKNSLLQAEAMINRIWRIYYIPPRILQVETSSVARTAVLSSSRYVWGSFETLGGIKHSNTGAATMNESKEKFWRKEIDSLREKISSLFSSSLCNTRRRIATISGTVYKTNF